MDSLRKRKKRRAQINTENKGQNIDLIMPLVLPLALRTLSIRRMKIITNRFCNEFAALQQGLRCFDAGNESQTKLTR
jgi:hypothetical protein